MTCPPPKELPHRANARPRPLTAGVRAPVDSQQAGGPSQQVSLVRLVAVEFDVRMPDSVDRPQRFPDPRLLPRPSVVILSNRAQLPHHRARSKTGLPNLECTGTPCPGNICIRTSLNADYAAAAASVDSASVLACGLTKAYLHTVAASHHSEPRPADPIDVAAGDTGSTLQRDELSTPEPGVRSQPWR